MEILREILCADTAFSLKCYRGAASTDRVLTTGIAFDLYFWEDYTHFRETHASDEPGLRFSGNSYWNVIIVMTTVRYGDIFPVSL